MKKCNTNHSRKLLLFFFLLPVFVGAQNLVPNGSFEDTVNCPSGIGEIYDAIGWSEFHQSPDYFNICNTFTIGTSYAGVPGNYFGYQEPKSGNAYAGFYSYSAFGSQAREMLGTQLFQPLIIGQKYFVAFYVCRGFNPGPVLRVNIATNKIGARFSTSSFSTSNPVPNNNFSQIYTDSIISDTLNWTKISGAFVADSAYVFVSFGNFFSDSATTHIAYDSLAAGAYYYIDNICVSTDSIYSSNWNGVSKILFNSIVKIIPNPASDWIEVLGKNIHSLSLYDIMGRVIFEKSSNFNIPERIDISIFPKGIYLLKININDTLLAQKVIFE